MHLMTVFGILCVALLAGCGEGRSKEHPFLKLEKRASEGDAAAQEEVGLAYLQGKGASQSFSRALTWFEACGEQGRPRCLYGQAVIHEEGLAVPISDRKAGVLFKAAVEAGSSRAMYRLGFKHRHGLGVPKDLVRGIAWLELAREAGNADAEKLYQEAAQEVSEGVLERAKALASKWRKSGPQF